MHVSFLHFPFRTKKYMKIKIKAKDRKVHRVQNHEVTEGLRKHFLIDFIGKSSHSSVVFWEMDTF